MRSFGIYSQWNEDSKELPRIQEFTTDIPAVVDIEFGFIVTFTGAKNQELEYCIDHPGIRNANGDKRPPFTGSVYVKTNEWDFFLGDTIWDPIDDKLGNWHLWIRIDGLVVAEKVFRVFDADTQ